jgi:NUMOD3 motif.
MYGYIYKTTDVSNGKIYIGQHKSDVFDTKYFGSGIIIKSIKKRRPQDLKTEVVEWCETKTKLNEREIYWISVFDAKNNKVGYNIASGGNVGIIPKRGGVSEEHKKKLSESHKGKHHSDETKRKMSESHKGKPLSEENKRKIGESNKISHSSVETKRKIGEAHKGKTLHKFLWLTSDYDVKLMCIASVAKWHKDWILIE